MYTHTHTHTLPKSSDLSCESNSQKQASSAKATAPYKEAPYKDSPYKKAINQWLTINKPPLIHLQMSRHTSIVHYTPTFRSPPSSLHPPLSSHHSPFFSKPSTFYFIYICCTFVQFAAPLSLLYLSSSYPPFPSLEKSDTFAEACFQPMSNACVALAPVPYPAIHALLCYHQSCTNVCQPSDTSRLHESRST